MLQRTQDLLNTSTVEFKVPSSTNGTRHARNGGNGHARRVRRQIQHGYRHAIRKADLAVTLVGCGMAVTEAIQLLNISSAYFYAMKALRESGDTDLYDAVLKDRTPFFAAAKSVKNAATVITAYAKCSELEKALVLAATGATADAATLLRCLCPKHLVEVVNRLGTDWVWDNMIVPAMPTKPATEPKIVIAEPAITDVT